MWHMTDTVNRETKAELSPGVNNSCVSLCVSEFPHEQVFLYKNGQTKRVRGEQETREVVLGSQATVLLKG